MMRGGRCSIPGHIQGEADEALNSLIQLKMSLFIAAGAGLNDLQRSLPTPIML